MTLIAVDTSALVAILLGEPDGPRCVEVLAEASSVVISAGTVAEALVVAGRRGCRAEMEKLLARLGAEVVPVGEREAVHVAGAYDRWGRGVHTAGLNFGDCFAYALAKSRNCALLFVGNDFGQTDIATA